MPWSNQNGGGGGPWGQRGGGSGGGNNNNNGGPWGGGSKDGGEPPDFDKILRRGQERIKDIMPSGGGSGIKGIPFFLLAGILLWFATGFYTVGPNEVGIDLVFGKYIGKSSVGAGLRYNWPTPIGNVIKLDVTKQETTRVGFSGPTERRSPIFSEALMLTGDDNVVFINFTVVWNIRADQADNFAFKFQAPQKSVKAVAESAMREYIGRGRIMDIITEGRVAVAPAVQANIQAALDNYQMGINVVSVQLADALAPEEVRQAFYDVEAASQKAVRYLQEAGKTRNEILPKARGDAAQIVADAQGYRQSKIEQATGQAARFTQLLDEYTKAPDIIRDRMFLETMERVFANSSKTIINTDSNTIVNMGGGSSVVPMPQTANPPTKQDGTP